MPVVRWFAVIALASLVVACTFDPGGTINADDAPDASFATADGANVGPIDAPTSLPIDAGPTTMIDGAPMDTSCDEMSDCPGQHCCIYAGGLASACGDDCIGGEPVCEQQTDCDGNDRCCENWWGPSTCGFCF
jgi:hypothetical protein